eukprot:scaffold6051_cov175-Prasinococcus_capsulatus_cf.AAC.1
MPLMMMMALLKMHACLHACMDGWMDGWMDVAGIRWIDGCAHRAEAGDGCRAWIDGRATVEQRTAKVHA